MKIELYQSNTFFQKPATGKDEGFAIEVESKV